MSTASHTFPTDDTLAELAARVEAGDDAPVVMLNLNRYKPLAEYADGRDTGGMSGRTAYLHYGIVAQASITAVGGAILWATDAGSPVIGCEHDDYDEVVAVWYPGFAAFLSMSDQPGYLEALVHRDAAIEQAAIIPCVGSATPVLTNPFG